MENSRRCFVCDGFIYPYFFPAGEKLLVCSKKCLKKKKILMKKGIFLKQLNGKKLRIKKIIKLYQTGFTYSKISILYGVSRQRIHQIVKNYSTLNSSKIRKEILTRDKYMCSFCSKNDTLHIHHIDGNSKNNKTNNLITLCQKCHVIVENNRKNNSISAVDK